MAELKSLVEISRGPPLKKQFTAGDVAFMRRALRWPNGDAAARGRTRWSAP